jgi:hypothetical protein
VGKITGKGGRIMKQKLFERQKELGKKLGCLALAVLLAGTGIVSWNRSSTGNDIPELVTFTDPADVTVSEEEVPLAAGTSVTKKTTTKTTTKKTTMKTPATKTSTTTKKTTKTTNSSKKTSSQQIKTNTVVNTTIQTALKKKSKIKTVKTTVKTTVTTTTTNLVSAVKAASTSKTATVSAGTYSVRQYAPKCDARVLNAFEKIGCKLVVNPSVSYSGLFDASTRTITLKTMDDTVYHEIGHFVEFVGGTSAVKQAIANAYNTEKSKYTDYNKNYVLQSSSEYFAESFKNYCLDPSALAKNRPNTYQAVVSALNNMTDARVNTLISVYSSIWK